MNITGTHGEREGYRERRGEGRFRVYKGAPGFRVGPRAVNTSCISSAIAVKAWLAHNLTARRGRARPCSTEADSVSLGGSRLGEIQ